MIAILSASLLVLAADITPPAGALCVQSRWGENDKITYVIPATRLAELRGKAQSKSRNFEIISCPVNWNASTTRKLCEIIDGFSDNLKAAMTEVYAISPDEMCAAAKEVDSLQVE